MKKLLALLLVLAMMLSLSSCDLFDSFSGGSDSEVSSSRRDKDDDDEKDDEDDIDDKKVAKSTEELLIDHIEDEHGGFYSKTGSTDDGTSYEYSMYYDESNKYFALSFDLGDSSSDENCSTTYVDLDPESATCEVLVSVTLGTEDYYISGTLDKSTYTSTNYSLSNITVSGLYSEYLEEELTQIGELGALTTITHTGIAIQGSGVTMDDLGFTSF